MKRNILFISAIGLAAIVFIFIIKEKGITPDLNVSPSPSGIYTASPTPKITPGLWQTLSGPASCELKGEIKFLAKNTYDNQDAMFTYKGVDHPGRNIEWTISPQDDIRVGPNIFEKLALPDGKSLLGIALPPQPKYRKYELTASVDYGRYEGGIEGSIKVRSVACKGKTTIVIPDNIQF